MTVTNSGGAMKNVKIVNEADLQENVVEAIAIGNADLSDIKDAIELIDDAVYTDGAGTPSKGLLIMGSDGTNPQALSVNTDGELKVNLETADIEIGAVELKDATTDTRTKIADGSTIGTTDNALAVADANVKSDTDAIKTAVEVMDDWDETNRAAVNMIPGQVGVAAGSGAADALTQRTIAATDDPGVTLLGTIDADTDAIKTVVEDAYNASDSSFDGTIVNQFNSTQTTNAWAAMTAPGNSVSVGVAGRNHHTIAYTVSSIDTSVDIHIEGSFDGGTTFVALAADSQQTTDGSFFLQYVGAWTHLRFVFVSEAGGTAAVVTPYLVSNC